MLRNGGASITVDERCDMYYLFLSDVDVSALYVTQTKVGFSIRDWSAEPIFLLCLNPTQHYFTRELSSLRLLTLKVVASITNTLTTPLERE